MFVSGRIYTFSDENIDNSPTAKGVYSLHVAEETIYIGVGDSEIGKGDGEKGKGDGEKGIRERLRAHKRGDEGTCTQQARTYRCEVCSDPAAKVIELLESHKLAFRKMPRCMEQVSQPSPQP